jgi:hypothetical protein
VPVLGLLLKLESRGPVFFKQLRTGKNGKPFYCLKFRSMRLNAEADARQASRGDSRITRIGAFIRKTSIDELPQFINVLRGDMSVVGPAPTCCSTRRTTPSASLTSWTGTPSRPASRAGPRSRATGARRASCRPWSSACRPISGTCATPPSGSMCASWASVLHYPAC